MDSADRWTGKIRHTLKRIPGRTIKLSGLLQALEEGGMRLEGRETWLLRWLEGQVELCRVIPDRIGPWARCPGLGAGAEAATPTSLPSRDPFILVWGPAAPAHGTGERAVQRIRESVTAWGAEVDDASATSVARWIRAHQEAEKACGLIQARDSVMV